MILQNQSQVRYIDVLNKNRRDIPDDRCLQSVFTILVDSLEDVGRFGLLLSLQRGVEVDTDLLRLEVCVDESTSARQRGHAPT